MVAVAELHIRVGWAGFDGGLYDRAMVHYARGLKLATEAGDAYCQALSLNCAGLATVEHGDPNEGLKLLQCGAVTALDVPPDRGAVVVDDQQHPTSRCRGLPLPVGGRGCGSRWPVAGLPHQPTLGRRRRGELRGQLECSRFY